MRITLDKVADAMYIYLNEGNVAKTEDEGDYLVDYDKEGKMLGIEVLSVSRKFQTVKGEALLAT